MTTTLPARTDSYLGEPGGPRDPLTPGGYCLARCYCGTCPQHARQSAAVEALRAAERDARDRLDDERLHSPRGRQRRRRTSREAEA